MKPSSSRYRHLRRLIRDFRLFLVYVRAFKQSRSCVMRTFLTSIFIRFSSSPIQNSLFLSPPAFLIHRRQPRTETRSYGRHEVRAEYGLMIISELIVFHFQRPVGCYYSISISKDGSSSFKTSGEHSRPRSIQVARSFFSAYERPTPHP